MRVFELHIQYDSNLKNVVFKFLITQTLAKDISILFLLQILMISYAIEFDQIYS